MLRNGPVAALLKLGLVALACGGGQHTEPAPSPTPGLLLLSTRPVCRNMVLPLATPILLPGGQDPLPSGFASGLMV